MWPIRYSQRTPEEPVKKLINTQNEYLAVAWAISISIFISKRVELTSERITTQLNGYAQWQKPLISLPVGDSCFRAWFCYRTPDLHRTSRRTCAIVLQSWRRRHNITERQNHLYGASRSRKIPEWNFRGLIQYRRLWKSTLGYEGSKP